MSVCRITGNQLRTIELLGIKTESPTVKTFTFRDKECAKARPGQFLMLWIPGVDEIPLSILDTGKDDRVSVAAKRVGEATEALHKTKTGDIVGVRGPFGNSFTIGRGKALMVGGGTGIAPLLFLAKKLRSASRTVFVVGAKNKDELLFLETLEKLVRKKKIQLVIATEDGTCGITGMCTDPLEKILAKEGFEMIYACGPEPMIRKVFDLSEKREGSLEVSLERLMRCAIGLCGTCIIGKYRVCKDGPVFTSRQLREVEGELGISKRDFDGRRIGL